MIRTLDQGIMSHGETSVNTDVPAISAAPGAAPSAELPLVDDAELARLVELWPTLTAATKAKIIRLIDSTKQPKRS